MLELFLAYLLFLAFLIIISIISMRISNARNKRFENTMKNCLFEIKFISELQDIEESVWSLESRNMFEGIPRIRSCFDDITELLDSVDIEPVLRLQDIVVRRIEESDKEITELEMKHAPQEVIELLQQKTNLCLTIIVYKLSNRYIEDVISYIKNYRRKVIARFIIMIPKIFVAWLYQRHNKINKGVTIEEIAKESRGLLSAIDNDEKPIVCIG